MTARTEFRPRQHDTEQMTVHVLWMTTGLGCDGDSVAMTAATSPSLEDIVRGVIPGMPTAVLHNPVLAFEFQRFTYGPIFRWFRKRNLEQKFEVEPEWRRHGATLTSGYEKRW